jgi:hypothetical protein
MLIRKNRYGISSRVLRNATKYDIPDRVVKYVARRDRFCVYCKLKFRIGARSRKNLASWEHMDGYSEKHPKLWNVALCFGSCNASRGRKGLAEWFDSAYCRKKNISRQTVAPVIQRYLERGLPGF